MSTDGLSGEQLLILAPNLTENQLRALARISRPHEFPTCEGNPTFHIGANAARAVLRYESHSLKSLRKWANGIPTPDLEFSAGYEWIQTSATRILANDLPHVREWLI
ncbi:hypothetical protein [Embleya sp. MST-111070]|uniref:hypothetical protein n=1 Tax=Embleya sp. MST-111070 TaxID=3398231 RepID=UPI003F7373AD